MTEEETISQEPVQEQGFVPLKPRAYHIPQESIDICNEREQTPAETIIDLEALRLTYLKEIQDRDKHIEDLKKVVPVDGRPIYTLQEIGDVVRKVCQTEGVMLHEKQKQFFREVFSNLVTVMKGVLGKP